MRCRWWLAALLVLNIVLSASGCLLNSRPDPITRPVLFEAVRAPKALRSMQSSTVQVSVFVGPSGCWALRGVSVNRVGSVLELSGIALDRNTPSQACSGAEVHATTSVGLPPLASGQYQLRAGDIELPIEVLETGAFSEEQFAYRGRVSVWGDCAPIYPGSTYGVLTGLPSDLPSGVVYVATGTVVGDYSCAFPGEPQFIVAVEKIRALEQLGPN